mmetsp:Transcript_37659/g.96234  ORF Transcript_37659/g.96234 Transcript_37659/m.96234 type:complete len:453 (-) Transcript_37659:119-1477(-)
MLEEPAADGMARLVEGHACALLGGEDLALLLDARDDSLDCRLEVANVDGRLLVPGGDEGGLVANVGNVRAGEAGGEGGHALGDLVNVVCEREVGEVHLVDLVPALDVGLVDRDLAVEAAGAEEGGVEDVDAVGARHDDDASEGVEAVHLDQELVERVLPLVVAAHAPLAPRPPHRVDLVDEDDAGGVGAGLAEEVTDPRGAHPDKHLDEVGPRDGEERDRSLPGHGLGHERLAGAGRAAEESPLGDLGADLAKLLGVLEKLDKLHDLDLGLGEARDVLERDLVLHVALDDGRLDLPHPEDVAGPPGPTRAHAPHHARHRVVDQPEDEERGRELGELGQHRELVGVEDGEVVLDLDAVRCLELLHLPLKRVHTADRKPVDSRGTLAPPVHRRRPIGASVRGEEAVVASRATPGAQGVRGGRVAAEEDAHEALVDHLQVVHTPVGEGPVDKVLE